MWIRSTSGFISLEILPKSDPATAAANTCTSAVAQMNEWVVYLWVA
ncbi:hypothetical protein SCH4B_4548 [Ruegeria sp. TrichCH4B]|nr:hypothetical protein SCH4B_4548 [Ruegeria sp. TrichCH4B]